TGNHYGLLPGEPAQRCVHDLFRRLNRAHRRSLQLCSVKKVCLSNTRTQRHHMNSVQPILFRDRFRKREDKRLRRGVRRHVWHSLKSRSRRDINDRAALAFAHRTEKAMRQIDQCPHVQLNNLELAIEIEFLKVAHRAEAGVVDEHLDLELAFLRLFKQLFPGVRLLQIEREILCANTRQPSELVAECNQLVFRARDQQHVSPACGEFSGKGCADSGRCSSNEGCVHQKTLLQLKQVELDYICVACLKLAE